MVSLFKIVVVHLDTEDDDTTDAGDRVCNHEIIVPTDDTLHDECKTSDGHRDETR